MGNKLKALLPVLLIGCALVGVFGSSELPATKRAEAQDSWSGKDESLVTLGATITTPAVIVTATTGKVIVVKSLVIASGTAGNVTLQTSSTVGTNIKAAIYLAANTPLLITEELLGEGVKTASGDTLYIHGPGTITVTARVQKH